MIFSQSRDTGSFEALEKSANNTHSERERDGERTKKTQRKNAYNYCVTSRNKKVTKLRNINHVPIVTTDHSAIHVPNHVCKIKNLPFEQFNTQVTQCVQYEWIIYMEQQ